MRRVNEDKTRVGRRVADVVREIRTSAATNFALISRFVVFNGGNQLFHFGVHRAVEFIGLFVAYRHLHRKEISVRVTKSR